MKRARAIWVKVYAVSHDGDALIEKEVSYSNEYTVVVRGAGGFHGGNSRHTRRWFELAYDPTPAQAVEKFIAREQKNIKNARTTIATCEQRIAEAEALAQRLKVAP